MTRFRRALVAAMLALALAFGMPSRPAYTAISADMQWWVMIGGSDTNGCGYDATLSGAGTNYASTASPVLTVADGVTTNGTGAVSSVTGGFTTLMKGDAVYISTKGRFVITARTDTNNITVTPVISGSSSGLTVKVGGACATLQPFSTTSTLGAPALTTPLAAGHIINVEGTSTLTLQNIPQPGAPCTPTYTGWGTGYRFPTGTNVESGGLIKFLAFNGIVCLGIDNTFAFTSGVIWQGWDLVSTATGDGWMLLIDQNPSPPIANFIYDSVFDQNGYGTGGTNITNIIGVGFLNSGTGAVSAALSNPAIQGPAGEPAGTAIGRVMGSTFKGWKTQSSLGTIEHPNWLTIEFNIFDSNTSGYCIRSGTAGGNSSIYGNTFRNCSGDAITFYHCCPPVELSYVVRDNVIVGSGGIAINFSNIDDARVPKRFNLVPDYNAFLANSGGTYSALVTAGPHDIQLGVDPWVSAATGNFKLNTAPTGGALLTATGWPRFFVGLPST